MPASKPSDHECREKSWPPAWKKIIYYWYAKYNTNE